MCHSFNLHMNIQPCTCEYSHERTWLPHRPGRQGKRRHSRQAGRQAGRPAAPDRQIQAGNTRQAGTVTIPTGGGVSGFGAARESETDCDVRAEKPPKTSVQ